MKLVSPLFQSVAKISEGEIFLLAIENQHLFRDFLEDLYAGAEGVEVKTVLSQNNAPIPIRGNIDIRANFAPFEINTRHLLAAITSQLEKKAVDEENYLKTAEIIHSAEKYAEELCFDFPFRAECNITPQSFVKGLHVTAADDAETDIERIFQYMELVMHFSAHKLFVFVNFRSFFDDSDLIELYKYVKSKQMRILLLESTGRKSICGIKQIIIDSDLCEF